LGKKHGIQTPVNETLASMIKFMERKNEVPRND
jgi:ketopantoate reductase